MRIVQIAIDVPLFKAFDYLWDDEHLKSIPIRGSIVKVEFGKKITSGIVLQEIVIESYSTDQQEKLKRVISVAPNIQITSEILQLSQFVSKYYLKPIGEVLFTTIPPDWKKPEKWELITKHRNKKIKEKEQRDIQEKVWNLNEEQIKNINYLTNLSTLNKFELILLKGITGSGKTAVYLTWLKEILKDEKAQCLILVPEINLTPQLEGVVKQIFINEEVTVVHSNISAAQRNRAWANILEGKSRVILGTRLSIFAPIKNLKAIVVDEEHDPSYKQQDGIRYNARDIAIYRGLEQKIPILLTSATPSSETWNKVKQNKITLLELSKKAKEGASIAKVNLIDLAKEKKLKKIDEYGISEKLHTAIDKTWKNKKQTLIYINRRGYAPILYCKGCAWKSNCNRCSAWMVVHKNIKNVVQKVLQCHHCGLTMKAPNACPTCGNQDLDTIGMGTQKIEEYLEEKYPQIKIIRVDSDVAKSKNTAEELFEEIHTGVPAIIIGTQMITKGHDFQNIETIIVLDVDKSLYSQDFRAVEKIFSQLVQVAGRAGRTKSIEVPNIYIQTEFTDHPMFSALENDNYDQFLTHIIEERKQLKLPPYTYQALIVAESISEQKNLEILKDLKEYLQNQKNTQIDISDPYPRVLQRQSNKDRHQILIETVDRTELQIILEKALDYIETSKKNSRSIRLTIDRDPIQF